MAEPNSYSKEKGAAEHILPLDHNRQLAYAHNGPPTSRTVILFFSGLMSIGDARNPPAPVQELGAHWITPTLAGMGRSSTRAAGDTYHGALARDMTALLLHLYPTSDFDVLYVAGGSYGTLPAQMLYGASYEDFPAGRKLVGCMLLAGFAPFFYHRSYAKTLTWQNWFSVGPPSQLIPFRLLQRLMSTIIASKLKTLEGTKGLLNQMLFSKMDAEEKRMFAAYLERKGSSEEEYLTQMAKNAITSCLNWDGFHEVSDVLHSDWGFDPAKLDDEHAVKPVMVVGAVDDHLGGSTNDWMAANYKSATLKTCPGGHISATYYLDDLWSEMIKSE